MKAGLLAAHVAVQAVRRSGVALRGDVLLASVQGEEDGGLGTFATLQRGWRADACVIPEPTDLDIIPANSGALTFRLRVHGKATHAARRTEGVSAIEAFWPVWNALRDLERRRHDVVDPVMARWPLAHPLSIGTVHAGDWASSVPDLLVAEGRLGRGARRTGGRGAPPTRRGRRRGVRRRCLAARASGRGRVVGRPVRGRPTPGRQRSGRAGAGGARPRSAAVRSTCTARRTAAICVC